MINKINILKNLIILCAAFFIAGTPAFAARENNDVVAVMYHDVTDNPFLYSQYSIGTEALESDIKTFSEAGYTFLKAAQLNEEYIKNHPNNKFVALTFDDGYESFYTKIYPILKKYNASASYYIITSLIDKSNHLTKSQLKELAESELVELGVHSHYVHKLGREGIQKLYNDENTKWDAYEDYKKSITVLEEVIGKKVTSIAYPNGIYNDDIDWILKNELGIEVTISTNFGCIKSYDKPFNRINRDLNYTSEGFLDMINNVFQK